VLALKKLRGGGLRRAYNLGTGTGVSVADIIAEAKRITGRDIRIVHGSRRAGDPARLVADPGRARADLGWLPRYSEIGDVIKTAWRWNLQRRNSRGLGSTQP
jgi:UDP-glucose 4-epimerase